ncbi:hypothetical protein, partial [Acinetobacter sp. YH16056]|uniref:hypothetical protein n=1 Tax=Acinetobacter sp. YH16056 TaxID=2601194 RepID=UPI0015D462EE
NFEQLIEQSEKPIINNTTLLRKVQQTTTTIESHLSSILTELGFLSPQAIKTLTASYTEQIEALQKKLANIDITEISKVKSSIDSFSTSIQALQNHINSQLQSLSIDKQSLQKSIQTQVQQAIANQSVQIESEIQTLISEKLSNQRSKYILWGVISFGILSLLMSFYLSYQASMNLKTIEAQEQIIQQNSQQIRNQIKMLEIQRR